MRVVGENIKRWRTRRGLNQAELALLSGLSRFTISKIEARPMLNPHPASLRQIAGALGCTVEDLWEEREDQALDRGNSQGHPVAS